MKLIYLLVLLLPFGLVAQKIKILDLKVNDIVYSKLDDKIYATLPSNAGTFGNSICIIDPYTAAIDTTIFIGSEPNKIAVSDNGKMIYVALDGAGSIRQFDVKTRIPGQQFSLGINPYYGPYNVEDMEFIPGTENSVAISRKSSGISSSHRGVAIYDSGNLRPNVTSDNNRINVIEMVHSGFIIGYNNETSGFQISTMSIGPTGVLLQNQYRNIFNGYYQNIHYSENRLYSSAGRVVDVSTGIPILLGTFYNALGPVVADTSAKLICFAHKESQSKDVYLKRYSKNNFILQDSVKVSNVLVTSNYNAKVLNLISWGKEQLAFNTSNGKLAIINYEPIGITESKIKVNFNISPNPTTDFVTINASGLTEFSDFQLISINGEVLQKKTINQFPFSVDMSAVAPGTYFIVITSKEFSKVEKVIKQ